MIPNEFFWGGSCFLQLANLYATVAHLTWSGIMAWWQLQTLSHGLFLNPNAARTNSPKQWPWWCSGKSGSNSICARLFFISAQFSDEPGLERWEETWPTATFLPRDDVVFLWNLQQHCRLVNYVGRNPRWYLIGHDALLPDVATSVWIK